MNVLQTVTGYVLDSNWLKDLQLINSTVYYTDYLTVDAYDVRSIYDSLILLPSVSNRKSFIFIITALILFNQIEFCVGSSLKVAY